MNRKTRRAPIAPRTSPQTLPLYGISTGYYPLFSLAARRNLNLDKTVEVQAQYVRIDSTAGAAAQEDVFVAAAVSRGLKLMLTLYSTTAPIAADSFGQTQATKFLGNTNILAFEITNEPDINGWLPNSYADFVKATTISIRAGDPSRKVVAGALWKGDGGPTAGHPPQEYVQALVTRAAGYFDYVSMHLYDNPLQRGSWNIWEMAFPWTGGFYNGNTCREILNAGGLSSVPIISTESGATIPPYDLAGKATVVSEAIKQAAGTASQFPLVGRCESVSIFQMLNDDSRQYGLIRMTDASGSTIASVEPAFAAMQTAIPG